MSLCQKSHRYNAEFESLPVDQGGRGRHRCAACAYERGYSDGEHLREQVSLSLDNLPESQAGTVRHKSPHAAYALGYLHGVFKVYGM
jgi:hypothetical protein